jgi:predicted DCC family thiol-disulfide oxidoreductase YuxK
VNNLPILFFDDRCGVWHRLVRLVLRHDARRQYRLVALESPAGRSLRRQYAVNQSMNTVVLIEDETAFVRRLQLSCALPTIEERAHFLDRGDPPG